MKVITKCVIDIDTLEVIYEESYRYRGEIALCKGSGGGGGSGAVSHSAYLETIHSSWLDHTAVDTITDSITDVMNSALGSSPFVALTAYDPDADLTNLISSTNALQTLVTLLSTGTTLDAIVANILSDTYIDDVVTEYAADLDARLIAEILPRFEAGMRDINAVVSSAFVIGRANIEEGQDRQVAKLSADLHLKAASDDALKLVALKLEYQKFASHMLAESYRMKIVAKKEETDINREIDKEDAIWDLEVFQYGGNLLAAIGGGTATTSSHKPSKAASAIGGAMMGAAAGAMIGAEIGSVGGPWGAAAGAVLGAASTML